MIFYYVSIGAFVQLVYSQIPPGQGGGGQSIAGQTSSTECNVTSGNCARDGSSNYMDTSALSYSTTTGIFTGWIVTNGCANNNRWGIYDGAQFGNHQASCVKQTFPAVTGPSAAPLRSNVGYSISGGVNIYGPFEAGFSLGQACDNNLGTCQAGLQVDLCEASLSHQCGLDHLKTEMFMDECGAHASPYHNHLDLTCDYNRSASGHSQLIGVALDGRGIYGIYESSGQKPVDLDACGGHYGAVPSYENFAGADNVYHYHTQEEGPFTLGCFGPVDSLSACKSLYDTCDSGFISVSLSDSCTLNYDTDCPCFKHGSETYNQNTCASSSSTAPLMKSEHFHLILLFFFALFI
jgi:hypothetical protein